jgi:hypothetical protein
MTKADEQARSYASELRERQGAGLDGYHPIVRDFIMGTGCFAPGEEAKMTLRVASKIAEKANEAFNKRFEQEFGGHSKQAVVEFAIHPKGMPHPWSSDPDRDAKVRMAEDGRSTPHLTLGECIEKAAPAASGGGEPQCVSSGSCGATTGDSSQDWQLTSSGREPVAWMCEWTDYTSLYLSKIYAESDAAGDVVPQPLYLAPPQPRGWLTEEEREAVLWAASAAYGKQHPDEDILRSLLARSTPPEVVLPGTQVRYHNISVEDQRDAQWIAALAAAGVAVKEVP